MDHASGESLMSKIRERGVTARAQFALGEGGGEVLDGSAMDADERGVRKAAHEVVGSFAGRGYDDDLGPGDLLTHESGGAFEQSIMTDRVADFRGHLFLL